MIQVTLLLSCTGQVLSVYEDPLEAYAKRDRYNADPFVEPGVPDVDAPYSVMTWNVKEKSGRKAS